jgi:Uma2 family endonuclease
MATVLEPAQSIPADERLVLRGVDWEVYEGLLNTLGDHPVRITFDGENLEIMSPSPIHEWYANLFGRLIEGLALHLGLPIRSGGSTTFKKRAIGRGLEPDKCFWIQSEPAVRGKMKIDLLLDHPPDLAIEVDITSSSLDRFEIYAKLRVPEIWRFDGETIRIHVLQPNGVYDASQTSRCLPQLPVAEIVPFLQLDDEFDDTARVRRFVEWASPRFKDEAS